MAATPTRMPVRIAAGRAMSFGILALWLVAAWWAQSGTGFADNGDFRRAMTVVTSGPLGVAPIDTGYPTAEQQAAYDQRYVRYWLPYWKLDFPRGFNLLEGVFNSSAFLLWLPGAALNYVFCSHSVLCLSWLSLFPKVLLFGFLLLMLRWIRRGTSAATERLLLCATLGIPYVLIASSNDYVAYFSSFYCETASLVFLFLFLACLVSTGEPEARRSWWRVAGCIAVSFLLTTARLSNLYWPFLALPVILARFSPLRRLGPLVLGYAAVAAGLAYAAVWMVQPEYRANRYDRLFYGVLLFSNDPAYRITESGVPWGVPYVGYTAHTPQGAAFIKQNRNLPYDRITLHVLRKEPWILARLAKCAADNMQDTSLSALGRRSADDPATAVSVSATLWTTARNAIFPKGYALLAVLIAYSVLFWRALRTTGLCRELAIIGLLASIACFVDMNAAVLGDGLCELAKHEFLANILFDIATIAALNVLLLHWMAWSKKWGVSAVWKRRYTGGTSMAPATNFPAGVNPCES
jgi:hypothetical protein